MTLAAPWRRFKNSLRVHHVLLMCHDSKIRLPIVQPVTVAMVDLADSKGQAKNRTVHKRCVAIDAGLYISCVITSLQGPAVPENKF